MGGLTPDVTMVGTELVTELGGPSMPEGCSAGRGGGGPGGDAHRAQINQSINQDVKLSITHHVSHRW